MIVLALASCQKEPDFPDVKEPANSCRPIKVYAYGTNTTISDSATYEYTNDKLTKADLGGDYITYEYSGSNIIRRNIFEDNTTQPFAYQVFSYGQDGNVSKRETFLDIGFGFEKIDSAYFTYNAGKLTSIRDYKPASSVPYPMALQEELQFTYTGNNITKIMDNQFYDGTPGDVESYTLTYDNQPNYFRKQSQRFLETDPIFIYADYYFYVFALSENNVTKSRDDNSPSDVENYSYTTDAKGNLLEMKVDGESSLKYLYECK